MYTIFPLQTLLLIQTFLDLCENMMHALINIFNTEKNPQSTERHVEAHLIFFILSLLQVTNL